MQPESEVCEGSNVDNYQCQTLTKPIPNLSLIFLHTEKLASCNTNYKDQLAAEFAV